MAEHPPPADPSTAIPSAALQRPDATRVAEDAGAVLGDTGSQPGRPDHAGPAEAAPLAGGPGRLDVVDVDLDGGRPEPVPDTPAVSDSIPAGRPKPVPGPPRAHRPVPGPPGAPTSPGTPTTAFGSRRVRPADTHALPGAPGSAHTPGPPTVHGPRDAQNPPGAHDPSGAPDSISPASPHSPGRPHSESHPHRPSPHDLAERPGAFAMTAAVHDLDPEINGQLPVPDRPTDRPGLERQNGDRTLRPAHDRAGGDRTGADRSGGNDKYFGDQHDHDEAVTERGLRGLVGGGSSQVSVTAAMRARDASRPSAADLAAAESDLLVVKRGWVPRDDLPRPGRR